MSCLHPAPAGLCRHAFVVSAAGRASPQKHMLKKIDLPNDTFYAQSAHSSATDEAPGRNVFSICPLLFFLVLYSPFCLSSCLLKNIMFSPITTQSARLLSNLIFPGPTGTDCNLPYSPLLGHTRSFLPSFLESTSPRSSNHRLCFAKRDVCLERFQPQLVRISLISANRSASIPCNDLSNRASATFTARST